MNARRRWRLVAAWAVALTACGGSHVASVGSATTSSAPPDATSTIALAPLPTMPPVATSAASAPTSSSTVRLTTTSSPSTTTSSTTIPAALVARGGTPDLQITLTVSPSNPRRNETVDYVIDATDTQSTGALQRFLDFGDGQQAPSAASPQFCTSQAPTQHQRWEFQHAYAADGSFTVIARIARVCGQGSSSVRLTLVVKA